MGGIGLLLLALSDDPRTRGGRVGECAAVLILGLSGPMITMIAPLFVYRWWRTGRSTASLTVGVVAAVAAVVQVVVYSTSDRATQGGGTVGIFVQAVTERVGGMWMFGPADIFQPGNPGFLTVVVTVWLIATVAITS